MSNLLSRFIAPLKIGKLELKNNIFYGPMAGCSDYAFRALSRRYSPGLIYTEMVKMEALCRGEMATFRLLDYSGQMHPIAAQMVGSNPALAKESAIILRDLGFDLIDLNCGCPVDKVTRDGSGSALLKSPEKIAKILEQMKDGAQELPITLKVRAGWDDDEILTRELALMAYESGAKAIAIHGRTREQGYSGKANWEWIRWAKEAAPNLIVIGNGDVTSPEKALALFEESRCDAVMISRGSLGRPWIVEEILAFSKNLPFEVTPTEARDAILSHLEEALLSRSSEKATLHMRKVACWYLRGLVGAAELRHFLARAQSIEAFKEAIANFDWSAVYFNGALISEIEA